MKKVLSVVLSVLMLIGMFSTVVLADGKPVITAEPQDVRIQNGEDAVFTVEASGEDLSYQWYVIGLWGEEPLEEGFYFVGVDTPELTVVSDEIDCQYNGDIYYCVVSNAEGSVESRHAAYYVDHVDEDGDRVCDLWQCKRPFNFNDIPNNDPWYASSALICQSSGLFEGDLEGNFNPNRGITRAEAATVLARFFFNNVLEFEAEVDIVDFLNEMSPEEFEQVIQTGAELFGVEEIPSFNDIEGKWYERVVKVAAVLGWINGYPDGSFAGDQPITRQEMAMIMNRFFMFIVNMEADGEEIPEDLFDGMFGEPIEAFADADAVAEWAEDAVEWARSSGLFQGDENGNFNPEKTCTRGEYAMLFFRIATRMLG